MDLLQLYVLEHTTVGGYNMGNKIERLPDTELEVMKVIWNNETPISTSQVKECLERGRPWNISTLQTLLNRLIRRGFLSTTKERKYRYYEPIIDEDVYIAMENKSFLARLNNNSVKKLVASLYNNDSITDSDLDQLREFIEENIGGE